MMFSLSRLIDIATVSGDTGSVSKSEIRPAQPFTALRDCGIDVCQFRCSSLCENSPLGRSILALKSALEVGRINVPIFDTKAARPSLYSPWMYLMELMRPNVRPAFGPLVAVIGRKLKRELFGSSLGQASPPETPPVA